MTFYLRFYQRIVCLEKEVENHGPTYHCIFHEVACWTHNCFSPKLSTTFAVLQFGGKGCLYQYDASANYILEEAVDWILVFF